ncbi:hypothetical protein Zmor_014856 [Zophobas morio]|uniref:Uncharacterized protein n=1 Tax=Zophobas morio TaxID=2755281 RepID=A0AA38ILL6_9CUCU|nr:hypothetical protein Zmor_014856 [Zophobas morio]
MQRKWGIAHSSIMSLCKIHGHDPLLASNGRELVYGEFSQFRVCRYGTPVWCAPILASVVQHLRDHGTFHLKLTIVAVIGQKEYCKLKNKSALADLQLKLEFHNL